MRPKKVLLVETTTAELGWRVLRGLSRYGEGRGWIVRITARTDRLEAIVGRWKPDAAVVHPVRFLGFFQERGIPVVQTFGHGAINGAAQVLAEDERIGELAAKHFLERGVKTVIYAGLSKVEPSPDFYRFQALRSRLEVSGGRALALEDDGHYYELAEDFFIETRPALARLLRDTPGPFGMMAYDIMAYGLYRGVREAGLTIPSDVCVLGVDDDDVYCQLCQPALSSIHIPWNEYGCAAGEAVGRLLTGAAPDSIRLRVSHPYLVTRASTAIVQADDPVVQRAVDFIRDHLAEPVNVDALCRELGVSPTNLKTRFRKALDRSPLEEIHRQKLDHVMHDLRETDRAIVDIAAGAGFSGPEHLIRLFKRKTGLTPTAYREQRRR